MVCVFRVWSKLLLPVFACLPLILFQAIIRSSRRERSHILSQSDKFCYLFSFQFSRSVLSDSLWPHGLQHARPPCPSPTPRACSNSCPLSRWCHPTISSLSSPSPPSFNLAQHQGLFKRVNSLHQVAKVLEFQLQHQSFQWIFRSDFL